MTTFVITPVFNEQENISDLMQSWKALLSEFQDNSFYFVLVDDGSTDETVAEVLRVRGDMPIEILEHGLNKGPGAAFATGFEYLSTRLVDGDLVVTMEGDNTSRIDTLSRMLLRQKTENIDVVLASPFAYGGYIKTDLSFYRTVLSHVANAMVKVLLNLRGIHTFSSFFRVYKGSAIKQLQQSFGSSIIYSAGFEGMVELLAKIVHLKLSASEVPLQLDWSMRKGKSKMKVVKTTLGYFKLFYILRTKPKPIGLQ